MTEQEWMELKTVCIRYQCPDCGPHLVLSSGDGSQMKCLCCRSHPSVSIESVKPFGEAEWLAGDDGEAMAWWIQSFFDYYRGGDDGEWVAHRKIRLFTCHVCRLVWSQLTYSESREAVELAEAFADGIITAPVLRHAFNKVNSIANSIEDSSNIYWLVNNAAYERPYAWASAHGLVAYASHSSAEQQRAQRLLGSSLHHNFGNPFRPYPAPESWPATVTQLANALYNGEDCGFALHDALLEAGHPELAEHFRQEQSHPKGCWVLDLILGKE